MPAWSAVSFTFLCRAEYVRMFSVILHRAKMRPAHRAEMRVIGILLRRDGIEAEITLVLTAKLNPRLAEGVVAAPRAGLALRRACSEERRWVKHKRASLLAPGWDGPSRRRCRSTLE